jgi:hypothetical protein
LQRNLRSRGAKAFAGIAGLPAASPSGRAADLTFDEFAATSRSKTPWQPSTEIIGGAVKSLPHELRASYPEVPCGTSSGLDSPRQFVEMNETSRRSILFHSLVPGRERQTRIAT